MDEDTLEILKIFSGYIPLLAVLAAAIWFFWTEKFKPRIQFDLECNFTVHNQEPSEIIAEIRLLLFNKGFVQHTLYNLEVSVHGLEAGETLKVKEKSKDLIFENTILKKTSAIPKGWYFWVRPGVNQAVTKIIKFDAKYAVI